MSSIMETGLSCASPPVLDDVAGPTRHSTAARKQAANGGGCPFILTQIEPAQVPLAHLIQFQDQHDLGREVEIAPHVARRQVGVEDSDAEVFQALRLVG